MDVMCETDLDEFGRDLDDPIAELEQDVVHMLLESYGSNLSAPERSIGLEDGLSGPLDPTLKHRVETKLMQDARISAAAVTLSQVDPTTMLVAMQLQVNGAALGITLQYDAAGNVQRVTS